MIYLLVFHWYGDHFPSQFLSGGRYNADSRLVTVMFENDSASEDKISHLL